MLIAYPNIFYIYVNYIFSLTNNKKCIGYIGKDQNMTEDLSGIKFTDLFIENLTKYGSDQKITKLILRKIDQCFQIKKVNRKNRCGNNDFPLTGGILDGYYHLAISRNPDIVLIYRIEGDHMIAYSLIDHHKYSINKMKSLRVRLDGAHINI